MDTDITRAAGARRKPIKRIDFYTNPSSQYGVLNDFTESLQKALRRQGIESETMDLATWTQEDIINHCRVAKPDCTAGFNVTSECAAIFTEVPHLAIMVDAIGHSLELVNSKKTVAAFVDQSSCGFYHMQSGRDALFFPHAIDREWVVEEESERIEKSKRDFSVVMAASYIDYREIMARWKATLSSNFVDFLEASAKRVLESDEYDMLWVFTNEFQRTPKFAEELAEKRVYLGALLAALDLYLRGRDREEVVAAIEGVDVHVFGEQGPTKGWDALAKRKKNLIVHDPVHYEQMPELFRHSEIVINSMPQFKDGLHERLFMGLAQGCTVLTNDSRFLRSTFPEFDAIAYYRHPHLGNVSAEIARILKDKAVWRSQLPMVRQALGIAHTWDNRAERLLLRLPELLAQLETQAV